MALKRKAAKTRVKRKGNSIRERRLTAKEKKAILEQRGGRCEAEGCDVDTEAVYEKVLQTRDRIISSRPLRGAWLQYSGDEKHKFVGRTAEVSETLALYVLKNGRWPCEVDHIVTLAEGGTNDPENLQVLCIDCHGKKTPEDVARIARSASMSLARHVHEDMKVGD